MDVRTQQNPGIPSWFVRLIRCWLLAAACCKLCKGQMISVSFTWQQQPHITKSKNNENLFRVNEKWFHLLAPIASLPRIYLLKIMWIHVCCFHLVILFYFMHFIFWTVVLMCGSCSLGRKDGPRFAIDVCLWCLRTSAVTTFRNQPRSTVMQAFW